MVGFGEWIQQLITQFLDYVKPWAVIEKFERGVLLTLGKFPIVLGPGYYPKLPLFQFCHSAIVTLDTLEVKEVNITTLDEQTVSIGCMVEFYINDIKKHLIDTNNARSNMVDICRGTISNKLEDITWETIRKKATINSIERDLKKKYEEMGVVVTRIMFTDKCKSRVLKIFTDKEKDNLML